MLGVVSTGMCVGVMWIWSTLFASFSTEWKVAPILTVLLCLQPVLRICVSSITVVSHTLKLKRKRNCKIQKDMLVNFWRYLYFLNSNMFCEHDYFFLGKKCFFLCYATSLIEKYVDFTYIYYHAFSIIILEILY